jgi:acetolactate synthase-1/2/3 large subunit
MGGGASGLNDGFIKNGTIEYISFHNEQGAAHAAIGEAKSTGHFSVVNPTTGYGGMNCMTSLLDAWQDSVPVVFISGNVNKRQCSRWINKVTSSTIRKYGIQEHDIISTVSNMTKYAVFVENVEDISYELDNAIHIATTGRPGPVWIDIPSDIQVAEMPTNIKKYVHTNYQPITNVDNVNEILTLMKHNEKPVVLAGQGIKQSKTRGHFIEFIDTYRVPFVSTYGARDLVPYHHPLNIGAIGIKGSRAGNFVMQSSSVLLILGCSLNNTHMGFDIDSWAPTARRIIVNNDVDEFSKFVCVDSTTSSNDKEYLNNAFGKIDSLSVQCSLLDFFNISKEFK